MYPVLFYDSTFVLDMSERFVSCVLIFHIGRDFVLRILYIQLFSCDSVATSIYFSSDTCLPIDLTCRIDALSVRGFSYRWRICWRARVAVSTAGRDSVGVVREKE